MSINEDRYKLSEPIAVEPKLIKGFTLLKSMTNIRKLIPSKPN